MTTFGSFCSGIGAPECAWNRLGWKPLFHSEIESFPCAVLEHRFPGVPNLGDMTQIDHEEIKARFGSVDVLVAGTPCFPADVAVLTTVGLKSIAEVKVGELVLTHKGRYRKVLSTGSKVASVGAMRGQGHHELRTTSEHPFWSANYKREWIKGSKKSGGKCWNKIFSEPGWVPASSMKDQFWAHVTKYPPLPIPPISVCGQEKRSRSPHFSDAFFWFVGAWLGDGWTKINSRRGYAILCCAKPQARFAAEKLDSAGLSHSFVPQVTTDRLQIASRALARWLREQFGAGCNGKRLPAWCLGMKKEWREALLAGYAFADGCVVPNGRRFTSVNRGLTMAMKMLAISLGRSATICLTEPERETPGKVTIQGRIVNEQPFYQMTTYDNPRSATVCGDWMFSRVRKADFSNPTPEVVYNLEVEEDNSYTADGLCVHNCQSFSVAGLREGMADPRGNLALVFLGLVDSIRPRWVVWENVAGVHSSWTDVSSHPPSEASERSIREAVRACRESGLDLGAGYGIGDFEEVDQSNDFDCFLGALEQLGYGVATRILDAQYGGVPQRRRRVFVVGCLGSWTRAAAVFFERESLFGNPPPRREAGQGITGSVAGCLNSGGGNGGFRTEPGEHLVLEPTAFNWQSGGDCRIGPRDDGAHALQRNQVQAIAYQCHGSNVGPMGTLRSGNGNETGGVPFIIEAAESGSKKRHARKSQTARSLDSSGGFAANQGGTVVVQPIPIDMRQASRGATMTNNRDDSMSSGGAPGTGVGEAGGPSPSLSISHPPAICFDTTQVTSKGNYSNPQPGDPCHPLAAGMHAPAVALCIPILEAGARTGVSTTDIRAGAGIGEAGDPMFTRQSGKQHGIAFEQNQRDEVRLVGGDGGISGSIKSENGMKNQTYVFQERGRDGGRNVESQEEVAYSLNSPDGGRRQELNVVTPTMAVRRLLPLECERLMNFPDFWTDIPFNGKRAADGPRYRALGNSMVVCELEWIGRRIESVEKETVRAT